MSESKDCEYCGANFTRGTRAEDRDWRDRRFCSRSCASRSMRKIGAGGKPCEQCGKLMTRPESMMTGDWKKKRYCDRKCTVDARRSKPASKACERCGEEFFRTHANRSGWDHRQYCGTKCAGESRKVDKVSLPSEAVFRDLYENQGLTTYEIAERLGVDRVTIGRRLRRFGIAVRPGGCGLDNRGIEPPTPEELRDLIHVQYRTYDEVAAIYGVDRTAVGFWLKKHGIDRPTTWSSRHAGDKPDIPDAATLRELYESGLSTKEIGLQCGASGPVILARCKQYGIERRKAGFRYSENYTCSDGLEVRSGYERTVGDWLIAHSVPFTYEPPIPFQGKMMADFLANGWYIEVWGVQGWAAYDEKRRRKIQWYRDHELPLIEIIPCDFSNPRKFEEMMGKCLELAVYSPSASRQSKVIRNRKINREGRPVIVCQTCGKDFVAGKGQIYKDRKPKYCSRGCFHATRRGRDEITSIARAAKKSKKQASPGQGFLF